jgi:hypothetical protein
VICVGALGIWLLLQFGFNGTGSRWMMFRAYMWIAEIGSLVLFYRNPWLMAFVGLLNMILVITRVFPWEEQGLQNFFYQFMFDIAFFIAGSLGALVRVILKPSITKPASLI